MYDKEIKKIFDFCVKNGFPIAVSKAPNKPVNIIISTKYPSTSKIDFELDSGFVFAPFSDNLKSYLIRPDIVYTEEHFKYKNTINNEVFFEDYSDHLESNNTEYNISFFEKNINYTKKDFTDLVDKAVNEIIEKNIPKIVVSRTMHFQIEPKFDPVDFFHALCEKHTTSFVSLVSIPLVGTWLGATPETLLKQKEDTISTMALASTQPYTEEKDLTNFTWDEKDIEEHEHVVKYIEDCFTKFKIKYEKQKPNNIKAGNVIHIQTKFTGILKNKKTLGKIIRALHPTPAVCGFPKKEAKKFIEKNEKHQRKFYTGFLGYLNLDNESELYVNLRCMELFEEKAVLYLGCGIVKDSDAEKEWLETEKKAETLLSVFKQKTEV